MGAELRQARERRGYSTRKLAEIIGRSSSHISRWENGRLNPSEADTATVLAVLGVNGADRDRLLELARDALDPNWVAPGIDKQLAALTEYERTAQTITNVEPLMIPGLLQTYEYARHIMIAFGASRGEAEQRATLRIGRQHVLTDAPAKQLVAIVGEYALRYPVCPDDVMVGQLRHLQRIAELDNVMLHVLPMDRPAAAMLSGSWALLEFSRTKPVLHLEHFGSSATITDEKTVESYRHAVDTLRGLAMSPAEATELIADVIRSKETTS
ncbi:helix-turn-helix domain-containing protein [Saccharopolyspora phatthalungensis]|uniref:Transcriptional regulator with XRE-family HTH domain n=1 Tax=Saccharopolyspora phatthalungensis TaxID=664693 RepID=A0A840QA08_9PSEU|nr:helix-turn-helix transcriptional regulator [Saccharopolyspora phatthalungensis]MBB5156777.1 transcriptional regulator with XRE-family HTH domain [Saccharopolyspora phatthalungensis]